MVERYVLDYHEDLLEIFTVTDVLENIELSPEEIVGCLNQLVEKNEQLKEENKKLKENLEHCANQFTNDGKNVLLSLGDVE